MSLRDTTKEHLFPCPHCGFELDDGDILESIKEAYKDRISDGAALAFAKDFGWTSENKKRFDKRVGLFEADVTGLGLYFCPECQKEVLSNDDSRPS